METETAKHPRAGQRLAHQAEKRSEFLYLDKDVIQVDYASNARGENETQIRLDPQTEEMVGSIVGWGIRTPIRGYFDKNAFLPDGRNVFILTSGFRRVTAFKMGIERGLILPDPKSGKYLIPVLPESADRKFTEEDLLVLQVVDNQHKAWSPVARAKVYLSLKEQYGLGLAPIAAKFGLASSHIKYYLDVAENPEIFQRVCEGEITFAVGYALVNNPTNKNPEELLEEVKAGKPGKITMKVVNDFSKTPAPVIPEKQPVTLEDEDEDETRETPSPKSSAPNYNNFFKSDTDSGYQKTPVKSEKKKSDYNFWEQLELVKEDLPQDNPKGSYFGILNDILEVLMDAIIDEKDAGDILTTVAKLQKRHDK